MLPWSLIATAGMPWRSTSAISLLFFAAPSSIENSVWTCRWTKELLPEPEPDGTARLQAEFWDMNDEQSKAAHRHFWCAPTTAQPGSACPYRARAHAAPER